MTGTDQDWRSVQNPPDEDGLGRLIRSAGRRPAPSASEYERVRLAAHLAWQMKVHGRRRRFVWLALAASVALAFVTVAITRPWAPPPSFAALTVTLGGVERFAVEQGRWESLAAGARIGAGSRLRTPAAGGAALVVADGGVVVRARPASEWTFDDATRFTLTAGTLYIDTGRALDTQHELAIVTPHGIVQHVGTQYEVLASTQEVRVRVREGRVRLQAHTAASYEAPAGQELRLTAEGDLAQRPFATDSPEWQWTEALAAPIELDAGSAFDALQWIARETGKQLVFEDTNAELLARNAIIHGDAAGLAPLQILEIVMATSTSLEYVLGEGTLVIRRR